MLIVKPLTHRPLSTQSVPSLLAACELTTSGATCYPTLFEPKYGTPLTPDLTTASNIIEAKSVKGPKHSQDKGKTRLVEVVDVVD